MSYTVGVDVGGTKIAAGLVDEQGQLVARDRTESPATDPVAIVKTIGELVRSLVGSNEVEAVGVCAAGFVDKERAMVVFAPNLAWRDEPLRDHLQAELDLPVVVENDANAAAWGEFTFGAGEDVEDLLMLTIGTGVGGGVVIDGELVRGGFGMGGEVGHIQMVPNGVKCGCGNLGCLESYGSGRALLRVTRELALEDPAAAARVLELAEGDVDRIKGPMITEAARAGDQFAIERLAELGDWIGQGVATLTAVLDPNVVVIGGGVSEAGPLLLDPIRSSFESHVTVRSHRPLLELRQAQLGNAGGPSAWQTSLDAGERVHRRRHRRHQGARRCRGRGRPGDRHPDHADSGPGSGVEQASVTEVEDALVEVVVALTERHGRCTVGVAAAGFVDAVGRTGALRSAPALAGRAAFREAGRPARRPRPGQGPGGQRRERRPLGRSALRGGPRRA